MFDAQAAIRRMGSEEPGPGHGYALQAGRHIATLRRARPDITIEIRWCPAHKGIPGNEKADEWAKLAAEEPDANGVEWLAYSNRAKARAVPLPRSLAHLKREIRRRSGRRGPGTGSKKKYRMTRSQRPDGTVAGSTKRLASRAYQLSFRVMHASDSTCTGPRFDPLRSVGGARAQRRRRATSSRSVRGGGDSRRSCGRR